MKNKILIIIMLILGELLCVSVFGRNATNPTNLIMPDGLFNPDRYRVGEVFYKKRFLPPIREPVACSPQQVTVPPACYGL